MRTTTADSTPTPAGCDAIRNASPEGGILADRRVTQALVRRGLATATGDRFVTGWLTAAGKRLRAEMLAGT